MRWSVSQQTVAAAPSARVVQPAAAGERRPSGRRLRLFLSSTVREGSRPPMTRTSRVEAGAATASSMNCWRVRQRCTHRRLSPRTLKSTGVVSAVQGTDASAVSRSRRGRVSHAAGPKRAASTPPVPLLACARGAPGFVTTKSRFHARRTYRGGVLARKHGANSALYIDRRSY